MQAPDPQTAQTNGRGIPTNSSSGSTPSDEAVIEKCRGAENAAKFSDLFDHGDAHAHHGGDDSAADLALVSMMSFWTQDAAQLERIFSSSGLGQRDKWRGGDDCRKRTIQKALADLGETYKWPREREQLLSSSPASPLVKGSDDDNSEALEFVWFSELGEPPEREFLIEKIGPKGYPITAFGAGGVAKSFAMLAAGVAIASASGVDDWLGLRVLEHGHVLYLDFELDADEQHRRVRDLCAGMGIMIPKSFAYLSGAQEQRRSSSITKGRSRSARSTRIRRHTAAPSRRGQHAPCCSSSSRNTASRTQSLISACGRRRRTSDRGSNPSVSGSPSRRRRSP